jgi:hypothetical protein
MNPIFDNRAALGGEPGLHVFLVGVSAYPHLPAPGSGSTAQSYGMNQISAAARTAYQMYEWLLANQAGLPLPLATVWLLLSPSALEITNEPALNGLALRPDLLNFVQSANAWRDAASTHRDGMSLFYFAGHGVQRTKDDAVLLLDDFGHLPVGMNPLQTSVDVRTLFYGMAPSAAFPQMARTQIYFVDACRNHPNQFNQFEKLSTTEFFTIAVSGRDDRIAPIFYAAVPDSKGYAVPGQHTVFSRQLLDCLQGGAGDAGEDDLYWQTDLASHDSFSYSGAYQPI